MKIIKTLILLAILTGCSSKYATKEDLQKMGKAADQNFQNQGGKIQILIEEVFKDSMAKGRAKNCAQGFNFVTGECLDAAKK